MNIRVTQGSNRKMAWTDRKGGYLELMTALAGSAHGGYFREGRRLLSDFFISFDRDGENDLFRANALYTDVSPHGFSAAFEHGDATLSLDVSLLIDERAFYIGLRHSSGSVPPFINPGFMLDGAPGGDDRSRSDPAWRVAEAGGFTACDDGCGAAIASARPFTVSENAEGLVCLRAPSDGAHAPSAVWYLAFEETPEKARAKALSLAVGDAILAHRKKIDAFLAGCAGVSDDGRFDSAVHWARFSAWMMVAPIGGASAQELGFMAGLPCAGERDARDSFISLSGALLVSGRFAEAACVLRAFSRRQEKNPVSPSYGRIPSRIAADGSLAFDGADATLWFIRALWEYLQYTADLTLAEELAPAVDLAISAALERRVDEFGFLRHGEGETWMDAIGGDGLLRTPRGDRASEVQALWYTALRVGARLSDFRGDAPRAATLNAEAVRVRDSFRAFFWCPERRTLADNLSTGSRGETLRDFRSRPNQVLAISVPSILSGAGEGDAALIDSVESERTIECVNRELSSPFGLFTLSPDDPLFHPRLEDPEFYDSASGKHNGSIWFWMTGQYVSACAAICACVTGHSCAVLYPLAAALLRNQADLILDCGCVGSLAGCMEAVSERSGYPVSGGPWLDAKANAEFARSAYQTVLGFNPRLMENRLELWPHLPAGIDSLKTEVPFGPGWRLDISIERDSAHKRYRCAAVWRIPETAELEPAETGPAEPQTAESHALLPSLTLNGVPLPPGKSVEFAFSATSGLPTLSFARHDFARPWSGSTQRRDYLARLLSLGRLTPGPVGDAKALEWFFDLPEYRDASLDRLPVGAIYSSDETAFRIWAPTASSVKLILFQGTDGLSNGDLDRALILPMQRRAEPGIVSGYWEIAMGGDLHGKYYRFRVSVHGVERDFADPSARACGINGRLSMVVDLARTDPAGWEALSAPYLASPNDAVVYELHVADVTSSPGWNGPERLRRTYEGAVASGTELLGVATGFDHIVGLGITHVQLLPVFDFSSVDESRVTEAEYRSRIVGGAFNWGYDPQNYCAPEGSYSKTPNNGAIRISELKALIAGFIQKGIGVVMDVVFNHVPSAQDHPLGVSVPGYYFRIESYSGAGDDTASERAMFRAYMIDALRFWLREYKLSGFRFDLMGLHDVKTMNLVAAALREIKPDVLLYGEGWDMYRGGGDRAAPGMHGLQAASMIESRKLPVIGFFNDAFRCGIKGSAFNPREPGFIHDGSRRESVKFGIVGAVYHPQVHNRLVIGTANPNPWSDRTAVSVNYTEIHDNATLYDKLVLVEEGREERYYERLQRTAIALVLLSQGMPVLHAGMEFMRTKEIPSEVLAANPELGDLFTTTDGNRAFSHNSYNLSDAINGLDWQRCADKRSLVAYTRSLIGLRRDHPLFRLRTGDEVVRSMRFVEPEAAEVADANPAADPAADVDLAGAILCWTIDGSVVGDSWKSACVAVNPATDAVSFSLPPCPHGGVWRLIIDGASPESGLREESPSEVDPSVVLSPKGLYLYAEF